MIIEKIVGNVKDKDIGEIERDYVFIEWYEVEKKVLHKVSKNGLDVGIRNNGGRPLRDGDILWQDDKKALIVEISECDCIAIKPNTMIEMGKACYEIGNRHAPLFIEDGELLTPFDEPLLTVLLKCDFAANRKRAKLKTPLGGHAHGHSHSHSH
ncbi:MAG: urease accessory protein [Petroclostridium sp.]|jgi:urease accessory protein|uniref:urease accessory protein UreE n=1 Tax=Petroclostridium xylanilyticum TaxID=1792311 RepID=UPI000B982DB4|nr:urease accessory protein UreE [Petroclostridium xylanilyticum]MBZ4646036.1 UreE urease accessory protein [Clostridia bacterium]MDK2810046.1 urease accessory protein [Petroclostridium sp.]